MDITDKELSMRPQYGIVGEESRGRVDYAIKVIFFVIPAIHMLIYH